MLYTTENISTLIIHHFKLFWRATADWIVQQINSHKPGPFKTVEVSPCTLTVDKDEIWYIVLMDWTNLARSVKSTERQDEYTLDQHEYEQDNNVYAGKWHLTADKIAEVAQEYAVNRIRGHAGQVHHVEYVMCQFGYTPAEDTF